MGYRCPLVRPDVVPAVQVASRSATQPVPAGSLLRWNGLAFICLRIRITSARWKRTGVSMAGGMMCGSTSGPRHGRASTVPMGSRM